MRRRYIEDEPLPPQPRPALAARLGRFLGLMAALFAITMAVVVSQKLSHDSLALLIGLSCGVMAMLPTLALGLFIWRREDARHQEREQVRRQTAYPATPPVIVVSPQALPNYGHPSAHQSAETFNPWVPATSERHFQIVGGDD